MQEIKTLIDKASEVCGSDAELALRMGIKVQVVSMLRHGRTITPETAAELADIAGENVLEAVCQAMLERNKDSRRGSALRKILGKSLALMAQRNTEKCKQTGMVQTWLHGFDDFFERPLRH